MAIILQKHHHNIHHHNSLYDQEDLLLFSKGILGIPGVIIPAKSASI